ncbi:hypothetical protein GCM10010329_41520 [Streptomyces spiroverticillatus]|uniref:SMI1/KNR4 family protein n=1 Tax=Streptomyces finlayi TaxID=67296 RepID=A0A918WZN2_9ACTN|nr:hypothetical protein [Streptomyces finlayi]GHA14319.1 hypothetical protein GCM10010329_41520 [Streptomyces spiroverticillatus]GHC97391.1 hypothetical protein GCM10010334_38720 [Streptomyces finlayi]
MSLHELERTLPAIRQYRAMQRQTVNWDFISAELGTMLPTDFMSLSEEYTPLVIGDFLALQTPIPGRESSYVRGIRRLLGDLESLVGSGMAHGYVDHPNAGGLLPWGSSNEGDLFYWRTNVDSPDSWGIVVSGHNDDWNSFNGSLTDYLSGLVSGLVDPDGLSPDFPGPDPLVESY